MGLVLGLHDRAGVIEPLRPDHHLGRVYLELFQKLVDGLPRRSGV